MSAASEQQPRRSFRLTDDEIWEYVASAHTGIMTTLRRDGMPIAMPLWFAAVDRAIYVHTRGKKLTRMAHDPRASFLVESGDRWADLKAVHFTGRAELVELDQGQVAETGTHASLMADGGLYASLYSHAQDEAAS